MTIGQKIRQARISQKLTQSDLSTDIITRNMLSAIESDKATPSLSTLASLANKLDLPLPYLLSEDDDLFFFRKKERISAIKSALESKNYSACISLVIKLSQIDDELAFILAECYFHLGVTSCKNGALKSAGRYLDICLEYCNKTMYDTKRFECIVPIYSAIAKNVNAPLLEFEDKKFSALFKGLIDYEFYRYLILDFDYPYTSFVLQNHINAKQLIKERKYNEAITLLLDIENTKTDYEYNAYIMYGVYSDLDLCYRKLFIFENAYKYSSKRLSLMEGFNS